MDIIKIDVLKVTEKGLNIQEYITLLFLYVTKNKIKGYDEFIKSFGIVSINQMKRLEEGQFIKIPDHSNPINYELREPTLRLFEGDKNLFLTWINTFPVKTPSGRYLSPVGDDTISAKKLEKKWKSIFGTDTILMNKVIEILQAEIDWRKKSGNIEYMHNSETWLNQGDWEKYEYLLTSYKAKLTTKYEDFI